MKKYVIVEHIGNLSKPNNGWTKELNIISWSNREPVYDIKNWNSDHTEYGDRIPITSNQMALLKELLELISHLNTSHVNVNLVMEH